MILIRVEPVSAGDFPQTVEEKKQNFLSRVSESRRDKWAREFDDSDLGNVVGCWFSPAYGKIHEELDALIYANDIIAANHEDSDLRVIAIEIPDSEIDQIRVCNLPENNFAHRRSAHPESEYVIPTEILSENAKIIHVVPKGTELIAHDYRNALASFEKDLNERVAQPSRQLRAASLTSC
jgi:hypothetical protein